MEFSQNDLNKILKLSHLRINEADNAGFLKSIQDILEYVEQLDQVDLDHVEPTAHSITQKQFLREDDVRNWKVLNLEKNAPDWQENCFKVPKISEGN